MPVKSFDGPRIPKNLLNKLGIQDTTRRQNTRQCPKKPYARVAHGRIQKTSTSRPKPVRTARADSQEDNNEEEFHGLGDDDEAHVDSDSEASDSFGLDNKSVPTDTSEKANDATQRLSLRDKRKLEEDDDEISRLEKKLGIKNKRTKRADDDGLDGLLGDLGDESDDSALGTKRFKNEYEQWLQTKRSKSQRLLPVDTVHVKHQDSAESDIPDDDSHEELDSFDGLSDDASSHTDEEEEEDREQVSSSKQAMRQRENPYVAPTASTAKYVPPSLRARHAAESADDAEVQVRIRRQAQGLLNRLSEANLLSIVSDVENLYRANARQSVTSTLVNLLLDLFSDATVLSDTFAILHGVFVAAVYKVEGTDFGAQFVESLVVRIDSYFAAVDRDGESSQGKQLLNLTALLSQLYNFSVISSNLMFDLLRQLLATISETHTELLLRLVKLSGSQLRSDDPSSLKDMVTMLRDTISTTSNPLSVRTKFMVESINDLKNNKTKPNSATSSSIVAEHSTRMRKTIGSLSQRSSLKATEPLRFTLQDIRNADKSGKWWLVGASWKGVDPQSTESTRSVPSNTDKDEDLPETDPAGQNPDEFSLQNLAKQQGMHNPLRRSIFTALLSSADASDAHSRILKLSLSRSQIALEAPRVLIHCASSESVYNPFYSFVAKRLCAEGKKVSAGFVGGVWEFLRKVEGGADGDDAEEVRQKVALSAVVNVAKMCAYLIANDVVALGKTLKTLELLRAKGHVKIFVEVLLVSVILEVKKLQRLQEKQGKFDGVQGLYKERGLNIFDESGDVERDLPKPAGLRRAFGSCFDVDGLAGEVREFIRTVVIRTEIVDKRKDKQIVKAGCEEILGLLGDGTGM